MLEFDEFMKIEGCTTKDKHLFVGSGDKRKGTGSDGEELVETVRYIHFYLWYTSKSKFGIHRFSTWLISTKWA